MKKKLILSIFMVLPILVNGQTTTPSSWVNSLKKTKESGEHYTWGDHCSGWHLVKSQELSIIEEMMPPGTQEKKHYHDVAEQFFHILDGTATFEIENEWIEIEKGEGIHIPPKTKHRIRNDQSVDLKFLVISRPTSRGDRFEEPFAE